MMVVHCRNLTIPLMGLLLGAAADGPVLLLMLLMTD